VTETFIVAFDALFWPLIALAIVLIIWLVGLLALAILKKGYR
jgi:hypothetical protein